MKSQVLRFAACGLRIIHSSLALWVALSRAVLTRRLAKIRCIFHWLYEVHFTRRLRFKFSFRLHEKRFKLRICLCRPGQVSQLTIFAGSCLAWLRYSVAEPSVPLGT